MLGDAWLILLDLARLGRGVAKEGWELLLGKENRHVIFYLCRFQVLLESPYSILCFNCISMHHHWVGDTPNSSWKPASSLQDG
jgi:hypothetical protein